MAALGAQPIGVGDLPKGAVEEDTPPRGGAQAIWHGIFTALCASCLSGAERRHLAP